MLLPMGVQFAHSLENHTHKECDEKNILHFHDKSLDCEFNHFLLNHNTPLQLEVFELDPPSQTTVTPLYFVFSSKETTLFSKSSRAPPTVII